MIPAVYEKNSEIQECIWDEVSVDQARTPESNTKNKLANCDLNYSWPFGPF